MKSEDKMTYNSKSTHHTNIVESSDDALNIKMYLFKLLRSLHWIVLSVLLCLLGAYLHLKYKPVYYSSKASLLVKKGDESSVLPFASANSYTRTGGRASMFGGESLSDEIAILRSSGIVEEAVDSLNYNIAYFIEYPVLKFLPPVETEVYNAKAPIVILLDSSKNQLFNTRFSLKPIDETSFRLSILEGTSWVGKYNLDGDIDYGASYETISYDKVHRFGEKIQDSLFTFTIVKKTSFQNNYIFQLRDSRGLVAGYKSSLNIVQEKGYRRVIALSVLGSVVERDVMFLNNLAKVFSESKQKEKEQYYNQSISFIDNQILSLTDSLKGVEDDLELFRKRGKVMDLSSASTTLLTSLTGLETKKSEILLREKYFKNLKDYIRNNLDKEILVPSLIGLKEGNLVNMLEEYVELSRQVRARGKTYINKEDIVGINPNAEIKRMQDALLEYIDNLHNSNQLVLDEVNKQIDLLERKFTQLPEKDRALVNIQRKFQLNDNIYTLLLSKRMELGITKAGITPDIQLLEPAKFTGMIASDKKKIFVIALVIGMIIPIGIIIVKDLLNDKFTSLDEVKGATSIPILGSICEDRDSSGGAVVVLKNPKSPTAEMFRSARMNIGFMLPESDKTKVIAVSSFVSGEGKTFCSINLACTLAYTGKRVVLIGADLRKPKISSDFGLDNDKGLSNYLSANISYKEIVKPSGYDNLSIILSGPEPPNPVELLETDRLQSLIDDLSIDYDYIIIDTAPLGLVSDYFAVAPKVDLGLFVVRDDYTRKKSLSIVEELYQEGKLHKMALLYNGVKSGAGYGYGYGYGSYGGSGYGYFSTDNKKGFKARLIEMLRK